MVMNHHHCSCMSTIAVPCDGLACFGSSWIILVALLMLILMMAPFTASMWLCLIWRAPLHHV